jgi:hypothetical protein
VKPLDTKLADSSRLTEAHDLETKPVTYGFEWRCPLINLCSEVVLSLALMVNEFGSNISMSDWRRSATDVVLWATPPPSATPPPNKRMPLLFLTGSGSKQAIQHEVPNPNQGLQTNLPIKPTRWPRIPHPHQRQTRRNHTPTHLTPIPQLRQISPLATITVIYQIPAPARITVYPKIRR